jgi:hypothetical protein
MSSKCTITTCICNYIDDLLKFSDGEKLTRQENKIKYECKKIPFFARELKMLHIFFLSIAPQMVKTISYATFLVAYQGYKKG